MYWLVYNNRFRPAPDDDRSVETVASPKKTKSEKTRKPQSKSSKGIYPSTIMVTYFAVNLNDSFDLFPTVNYVT